MKDIEQTVKEYIVKEFMFDRPTTVLANDLPLIEEGIIDSLGIFLLIAFIEDQFKIKIQPEDVVMDNFESVNAIKRLISPRLPSAPPPLPAKK